MKIPFARDFKFTEEDSIVENHVTTAEQTFSSSNYPETTDREKANNWAKDMIKFIIKALVIMRQSGVSKGNPSYWQSNIRVDALKGMCCDLIFLLQIVMDINFNILSLMLCIESSWRSWR